MVSTRKLPDIGKLTEAYGASGHEAAVREEVKKLLPEWARKKVTTDAAGNLVLHWGDGKHDAKTPSIAFVAHMDELGFEVKKIEDDGRLLAESLGGGYPQYFLGHVALVHKKDGTNTGGVMELPEGWDKPNFEFSVTLRSIDEPAHVYVGTRSKEETEKLGIAVGDYVTIPKEYRPLLGTRANARSFDDRVGCTALIEAARKLGPELPGRDVTFVWSTEEEVGLKGAAAFAEQAAKENRVPDFVFAIDTFVSSDSPLESKRFADAELGKGFVIRAVDNSNIAPLQYVDRVIALGEGEQYPGAVRGDRRRKRWSRVHEVWIGGYTVGLAAEVFAFTGGGDRYERLGCTGSDRRGARAQMVKRKRKDYRRAISGATELTEISGRSRHFDERRAANRSAMADQEKCCW